MSVSDSKWESGYATGPAMERRAPGATSNTHCVNSRIIPWGSRPVGLPFNHGPLNKRTRIHLLIPLQSPAFHLRSKSKRPGARDSHQRACDSSVRAKTWNEMANYQRWSVGHRLIGLQNVACHAALFFCASQWRLFARKAIMSMHFFKYLYLSKKRACIDVGTSIRRQRVVYVWSKTSIPHITVWQILLLIEMFKASGEYRWARCNGPFLSIRSRLCLEVEV